MPFEPGEIVTGTGPVETLPRLLSTLAQLDLDLYNQITGGLTDQEAIAVRACEFSCGLGDGLYRVADWLVEDVLVALDSCAPTGYEFMSLEDPETGATTYGFYEPWEEDEGVSDASEETANATVSAEGD